MRIIFIIGGLDARGYAHFVSIHTPHTHMSTHAQERREKASCSRPTLLGRAVSKSSSMVGPVNWDLYVLNPLVDLLWLKEGTSSNCRSCFSKQLTLHVIVGGDELSLLHAANEKTQFRKDLVAPQRKEGSQVVQPLRYGIHREGY